MSREPLLSLEGLSAHYVSQQGTRVVRAVDDVTLSLGAGETLGIVGESGSGKSTLALTIMRLLPPAARIVSGRMMFEGENLLDKSDAEMRRVRGKRIAMILQDPMASLNPLFSIGNQVGEPIRVHERASATSAWRRAIDLLKSVRIASPATRVTQFPHQMSGGMRQRIVGAIGISCEPRLLIADEPTTSLDLTIQAQYLALLRPAARARAGADLHHPQSRHRRQDVRPARRDVRRTDRREGAGVARVLRAGASLHQGAARLDPAEDGQPRASHRH